MKLSGFSNVYNNPERHVFPMSKQNEGSSSFLDEMEKTSDAATAEKMKNSIEAARSDGQLKLVYEHLSPSSKSVLERIDSGTNDIQKDEWLSFCKELKDAGVITQSDFDFTRSDGHLIPIGYYDVNGNFVKYDTPPMLVEKLHTLSGMSQSLSASNIETWISDNNWAGDPMKYLDSWMSMLNEWRHDLAGMRAADGSLKYDDFSLIDNQMNSCLKVSNLVKNLCRF